mmetsp:Transcript_10447/g.14400  ORF Transcript_10447/g.14400 Transcript_10447/m.14400 type:complete len:230 (-) Transcript_10447:106-795(-)|eukprot:CAMPEP_0170119568 /NCGR_PEP_ID=MMETSP0020_2-20130122/14486_1 /TAXON_ID=98059 /ORGANISM="Dinobryon sp., Strain UTEXLB2267" /LENGTH=229 /DNA_ID=CAMNT_0010348989 /DNA_START=162 /DNA_END=851 /DNA_ORIENTATION=+
MTGKFLVLDTVQIKVGSKEKRAIDLLTDGGKRIEAVIATHPFHTTYFEPFASIYPGLTYYGTPRHLRKIGAIKWTGNLNDEAVRSIWESDDIYIRIPEGAEFVNPPEDNHFIAAFVLHTASKTVFVDDTIMYMANPNCMVRTLFGKNGDMLLHTSTYKNGLLPTPEAPLQFLAWIRKLCVDWDFDNMCTAHCGNKIGAAKEQLSLLIEASAPKLEALAKKNEIKANGKK